jgi:hypothetical protein
VVSDGRWELIARQRQAFEPLFEVPPQQHLRVDTTQAPTLVAEVVVRQLAPRRALPLRSSCPATKTDPRTSGAPLASCGPLSSKPREPRLVERQADGIFCDW